QTSCVQPSPPTRSVSSGAVNPIPKTGPTVPSCPSTWLPSPYPPVAPTRIPRPSCPPISRTTLSSLRMPIRPTSPTPRGSPSMAANGSVTVGASAIQVSATSVPNKRGVLLKADAANGNKIYVGNSSAVTAATNGPTDGYQLSAGTQVLIPPAFASDLNLIYVIA